MGNRRWVSRAGVAGAGLAALVAACAALSSAPTQPTWAQSTRAASRPDAARPYVGSYRHTPSPDEDAAFVRAIDAAIAGMSGLEQGLARDRLRDRLAASQTVTVGLEGDVVVVTTRTALRGPLDAPTQQPGPNGRTITVLHAVENSALVERVATANGEQTQSLALDASGRTLTLTVTVTSARLPRPLRFTRTYTRV